MQHFRIAWGQQNGNENQNTKLNTLPIAWLRLVGMDADENMQQRRPLVQTIPKTQTTPSQERSLPLENKTYGRTKRWRCTRWPQQNAKQNGICF